MSDLNPCITRQNVLINELMQKPLIGFSTGEYNKQAIWDDIAFRFTFKNGRSINFYCVNNTVDQHFLSTTSSYNPSQVLPKQLRYLLIAFAIDIIAGNNSANKIRDKIAKAREFLSACNDNPAYLTQSNLDSITTNLKNTVILNAFFKWLHHHQLIPNSIKLATIHRETTSGLDTIDNKKQKIPETNVLLALGSIFHDEIPSDRSKWDMHSTANQRNPFIAAMSAIAMASPNRADAEQTVLDKQRLKIRTESINGKNERVHYLEWQGSKGFINNRKHFLDIMSEPVDRSLEYMGIVCEPARALARFYEKPSLPLKTILGEFLPSQKNMNALNPDMDKPIMLIQLGYLLGFYDNGNGYVRVSEDTHNSKEIISGIAGKYKRYIKKIINLKPEDELLIAQSCPFNKYLHGMEVKFEINSKKITAHTIYPNGSNSTIKLLTVAQFQDSIIKYSISKLPGFPIGINNSSKGKCKYKNALFAFTVHQLAKKRNGNSTGCYYFITSLSSLKGIFIKGLKSNQHNKNTIFSDYNFSSDFNISPNSLRHWHNDIAERQGVPHALINLWSGRKNPEQILHYIHRTNAEKAAEIADIIYSETKAEDNISIKVISKNQFEKAVKTATTVTNVGLCTQNLHESPCEYLNDFLTQCSLCPSSCHIAHDKEAITLLKKDLVAQNLRLDEIKNKPTFCQHEGLQKWFAIHFRNTHLLQELVALMEDSNIKAGSIIRILSHRNIIRITDIEQKLVTEKMFSLPDTEDARSKIIDDKSKTSNEFNEITKFISDLF